MLFFSLVFIFSLFIIGFIGIVLNRYNLLIILMALELVLLSINLLIAIFSVYTDNLIGMLFILFILTVAAAESAVGLAILVSYFRLRGVLDYHSSVLLHG